MKRSVFGLCLLLALLAGFGIPREARAEPCGLREDRFGWYVPDYVKIQTGGHQGLLTLVTGYLFFDGRLDLGAQYGWVPSRLGGRPLHSLGLKAFGRARGICIGRRIKVNWSFLYAGLGVIFPVASDGFFFVRVPERYRGDKRRYYPKTGLRTIFTLGTEFEYRQTLRKQSVSHSVYWEVSALDDYMYMWAVGRGRLPFWFPWSSAFGYRLHF